MATPVTEDFNSYSDGDLHGQGSWVTTSTAIDIQGTTVKEGAKAVTWPEGTNDKTARKTGDSVATGRVTFYMYPTATNKRGYFELLEGSTSITWFAFQDSNVVQLYTSGGWVTIAASYTSGVWHECEIEWRSSDHKLRARIDGGTYTDWYLGNSSYAWTGIDTVGIVTENPSGTFYLDTIQQDPYSASAGTNMKLNIADSWKTVDSIKINIADSWKSVTGAKVNIADTWKTIF